MIKKKEFPNDTTFKDLVQDIKPLNYVKKAFIVKKTKCIQPVKISVNTEKNKIYEIPTEQLDAFSRVVYTKHHVSPKNLKKQKRFVSTNIACIDLHGCYLSNFLEYLEPFIEEQLHKKTQHLQVIHGKGNINNPPKLKTAVSHWLKQQECVLGFWSCPEKMGGCGALIVWLKTSRTHT